MGNGASTADIDLHLRKWEGALNDLTVLCGAHRRAFDQPSPSSALSIQQGSSSESGGNNKQSNSNNAALSNHGDGHDPTGADLCAPPADPGDRTLRRRASSLVSFNANVPTTGTRSPETGNLDPGSISPRHRDLLAGASTTTQGIDQITNRPQPKHNRQQAMELRKNRVHLYKSYADVPSLDSLKNRLICDHFAAVAVGLSSVLGGTKDCDDRRKRVTVEDIFFAAQVPLHMLHTGPLNLAEMMDIVREFIDVDNRFKNKFTAEVVHFDIAPTVGQVEMGQNEVGDRQAKVQLPEFRKSILQELDEEAECVRLIKYDPFLLEQAMLVDDADLNDDAPTGAEADDDEAKSADGESSSKPPSEAGLLGATSSTPRNRNKKRYQKVNDGAFAAIVDTRNAVEPMVTIAEAAMDDSLHVNLVEVTFNALYKAILTTKPGHRARGYIRVMKKVDDTSNTNEHQVANAPPPQSPSNVLASDVNFFYSPELCSGKVLGTLAEGSHAHVLSQAISPHIAAIAWALHLLGGARPNTHGHGKGLCVGDIIRTLKLPHDCYLESELPLEQVFCYTQEYLKCKSLEKNITVSLFPVLTKISRDDAVPTISVFDLESILIDLKSGNDDPETPVNVMVVQYNANIAHNVIGISDMSQWCILAGYDEDTQYVRFLDASPKKYGTTWTCRLDTLHKAMTGFGYMVLSRQVEKPPKTKSADSSRSSTPGGQVNANAGGGGMGGLRHVSSTVQQRLDLLKGQTSRAPTLTGEPTFSYPKCPTRSFAITVMAAALHQLGVSEVSFDHVVHTLPFEINSLFSKHFGLESFVITMRDYLQRRGLHQRYICTPIHFDRDPQKNKKQPKISLEAFKALITENFGRNKCIVVHYARAVINIFGVMNPFGDFGTVVGFDERDNLLTISDGNPNSYLRTWCVSLDRMHTAISRLYSSGHRSRGLVIVTDAQSAASPTSGSSPSSVNGAGSARSNQCQERDFHLWTVPTQTLFHVSPSPQIQALSMAYAQLGFFFSPEEIFYEAYLKTMNDQRRRGSQAFAWRDVEVSLAILNTKIDTKMISNVSRKFLESRKVTGISAEVLDDMEDLDGILKEATDPASEWILLVSYNAAQMHGVVGVTNSVALVQAYDPVHSTVTLFEAEYSLFGLYWNCTTKQLIEAADLDNAGLSKFGFVKVGKRIASRSGSGTGLRRGGSEGAGAFGSLREGDRKVRTALPTFVEEGK